MSALWSPSVWFLAETNHVLAASLIVLMSSRQRWSIPVAVLWMTLIVAVKEFWADLTWLEHDTVAGSVTDFVCYMIGALGTWLSLSRLWAGVAVVSVTILGLTVWDILVQHFPLTFGP